MPTIPTIKAVFEPIFAEEFPPTYGIVILDGEPKSFSKSDINSLDKYYYLVSAEPQSTPVIARKQ